MTSLRLACVLFAASAFAAGPKVTGTYLPAVAAGHVELGDFGPIDLATAATFTRDTVKVEWPSESNTYKWRSAKQGIEVKPDDTFLPISWIAGGDGSITTQVLYATSTKPESTVMKWVPQSIEALWALFQKRVNAREFKRLAGTWKGGEHTLEISPEKVTWDGKAVTFNAGDCRAQCAKYGTICLTPPTDKMDRVPRLAYLSGTLVEVTWEAVCGAIPGEAWGYVAVPNVEPLRRTD